MVFVKSTNIWLITAHLICHLSYSNFNSSISEEYKVGLIFTLLFWTFSIVSDFSRFHLEVCDLKEILQKKAFSIKLIDRCIKSFLNKRLTEKPVPLTADKKDLVIVLPFFGKLSLNLRTGLKNTIGKDPPFCKIRVIFKSSTRISSFFQFKDEMRYCFRSNVVSKLSCVSCNATYYGKICQHLSVRVDKHWGISPLTGKPLKSKESAAAKDHMLLCDHIVSIDDFNILQPVTQISILKSKKFLWYHGMNSS